MTWGQLLRAVLSTLFGARARTLLSRLRDLGRSLSSLARTVASPLLARGSQRAGRGSEEPTPDEAAAPTAEEAAGPDPAQPVQTFPEDTGKPRRVGFLVWGVGGTRAGGRRSAASDPSLSPNPPKEGV